MAAFDVSNLPTADSFSRQLEDFRTTIKTALVQLVSQLGDEADASLFDMRFVPITLSEPAADVESLTLTGNENEPLLINFANGAQVEIDELSTDDVVNLYQVLMDLTDELNEDDD